MGSLEEIQTIKNQKTYGTGSGKSFKMETEILLLAAQEQALNNNSVRMIYRKDGSNKCRLCGTHVKNVLHIVSGCSILAQKNYKRRQDKACEHP